MAMSLIDRMALRLNRDGVGTQMPVCVKRGGGRQRGIRVA
jgi:hypothetical protein